MFMVYPIFVPGSLAYFALAVNEYRV